MDHIGIDLHKRESQIYILAEGGEVVEQRLLPCPHATDTKQPTTPRTDRPPVARAPS